MTTGQLWVSRRLEDIISAVEKAAGDIEPQYYPNSDAFLTDVFDEALNKTFDEDATEPDSDSFNDKYSSVLSALEDIFGEQLRDYYNQEMSSESKTSIHESNLEKNKKLIEKMLSDQMTIEEITDTVGLTKKQVYFLAKDYPMRLRCPDAYHYISEILKYTDLINNTKDYGTCRISVEVDWFTGTFNFEYEDDKYNLQGYATIYWDGNCDFPIDIGYFHVLETGEYNDEYDELQARVDSSLYPKKYNSISEMIDFMNEDYFDLIVPEIRKSIPHYKKRLGI